MSMVSDLQHLKRFLAAAGVSEDIRVRDLTSDQEDAIRRESGCKLKLKVTSS